MRSGPSVTSLLLAVAVTCTATRAQEVRQRRIDAPPDAPHVVWPSTPPDGCPFEPSTLLVGVAFTGRHSDYHCGDTFYPSWASDDHLYSPWTDGTTDGVRCGSGGGAKAHTGHAVLVGDDPLQLTITNTSPPKPGSAEPYLGRYPCGSLVHDGVWYYGTYCLGPAGRYAHRGFTWNWPNLGPMPGFQISYDLGKTWEPSPHSPDRPLFPEPDRFLGPVRMGAPHFVDFGRNMQHSPDGKAYLLGMGALETDPQPRPCIAPAAGSGFEELGACDDDFAHANLSWITADQVYLARVTPSPETINELTAYEFFAGHDGSGEPVWTSDFRAIAPLIEWNNHMGCVTATYVPGLDKYLMCITDGWPTVARMDSYILEADVITGPWRLVSYLEDFGEQAYFLNFPSKFIAEDGRTLWLCYSANFSRGWNGIELQFHPPGGRYGLCLHEMRLLAPGDPSSVSPLGAPRNLARIATVTASSTHPEYGTAGAVDGVIGGHPGPTAQEWASDGESDSAFLRLTWNRPVVVERVLLFDRPNLLDQVTSGMLVFSDGSTVRTGELPDDAAQGLEVAFAPRTVKWLAFFVSTAKAGSPNIGLAEIAVLRPDD
ncbi:MAG: hypothetical protein IPM29_28745 [Planctomycetes bacterium]|nr:hypothetical protein [Planctomycetota bacterium]